MAERIRIEQKPKQYDELDQPVKLFMDSGVFGAWSRGITLDIKQYIAFIKRYEKLLFCYATMDQIPGRPQVARTKKEVDESAAVGYRNHQILKDAGLTPIPIFHQGESFKYLEQYLKDGEPYIGIATAKDMPGDLSDYQHEWLDQMFSILTNEKGVPYVKTHGFGITKINFMLRYPWYTCDSTTWSLAAGFGMIYVPRYKGGQPDYSQLPTRVIMSGVEQKSWSSSMRQYDGMGPTERAHVEKYIAHLGLTVKEVAHMSSARRTACIKYFNEFCATQLVTPFAHRHPVGVGGIHLEHFKAPKIHKHKNVMFATMVHNRGFSRLLTAAGGVHRLVSYFDLFKLMEKDRDKLDTMMHNYITLGIDDPTYEPRAPKPHDVWGEHYMSHRRMNIHKRLEGYQDDGSQ